MGRLARRLTPGEVALTAQLFGGAVDCARVRVHNRRYLPFVQPKNCAMTPNGSLYFHASRFLPDYAAGEAPVVHWFMHEMVLLSLFARHCLCEFLLCDFKSSHYCDLMLITRNGSEL